MLRLSNWSNWSPHRSSLTTSISQKPNPVFGLDLCSKQTLTCTRWDEESWSGSLRSSWTAVTSPASPETQSVRYTRRQSACALVSEQPVAAGARTELSESSSSDFFFCVSPPQSEVLLLSSSSPYTSHLSSARPGLQVWSGSATSLQFLTFSTDSGRDLRVTERGACTCRESASETVERLRSEDGSGLLTHVLLMWRRFK